MASASIAFGQSTTTTTTTWTNDDGTVMRQDSTTRHLSSYDDPRLRPDVGVELPGNVTVYPLPQAVPVPSAERYSYGIINNNPVVIDRTTRRVVHTWE
jgi:hypothetical protein